MKKLNAHVIYHDPNNHVCLLKLLRRCITRLLQIHYILQIVLPIFWMNRKQKLEDSALFFAYVSLAIPPRPDVENRRLALASEFGLQKLFSNEIRRKKQLTISNIMNGWGIILFYCDFKLQKLCLLGWCQSALCDTNDIPTC